MSRRSERCRKKDPWLRVGLFVLAVLAVVIALTVVERCERNEYLNQRAQSTMVQGLK